MIYSPDAGQMIYVHRLMFEAHKGPIPEGLHVCHTCDNPACARPDHLFAGSQLDNMRDMHQKGRNHSNPGEANPHAKLTEEQARALKKALLAGGNPKALAAQYGISLGYTYNIKAGRKWAHLEIED
jgi:hypothetical protein